MTTAAPRRIRTKERLLDAALAMIAQRGVGAATVEQVCERAGFTRGAFYSNFDSWDDLYLSVLQRECLRIGASGDQAIADLRTDLRDGTGRDEVCLAVEAFVRAAGHDAAHVLALVDLRLYATRNPALWPGFLDVRTQVERVLRDSVRQVLQEAGLHLMVEADVAVAALGSVYESVGIDCVMSGADFTTEVTQALSALLQGLVRPA